MWYLQKKGKTEGPIPDATLVRAIEKGDIGPLDLLFKEGEYRWRAAAEYRELQGLFQLVQAVSNSNEDEWIILSKVRETKSFKQKGPFKTSEIKRKLKSGEVLWSDYAWREGMKEWYRVTALEIFHGEVPLQTSEDVVTHQFSPISQKAALDNVQIMQRPQMPIIDERPPEAEGPDLTQKAKNKEAKELKKAAEKEKARRPHFDGEITQTKTPVLSRRLSIWDRFEAKSPSQKWWISAGLMVLIISTSVTALFWSSYQDYLHLWLKKKKSPEIESVAEVQKPVKAAAPEAIQKPIAKVDTMPEQAPTQPPAPPAPVEEKIAPTQIKAVVKGNKSEAPTIEIQTDASSHFSLNVKISGRLASVLGARSFFKQIRLKTLEERNVNLKKYGLRPGLYDIQVQFDGEFEKLRSQAALEVASNDKDFKNQLIRHRKGLTHWATNERVQLIRLVSRSDEQLGEYLKEQRGLKDQSLRDYYRAWQKRFDGINSQTLKAINARNRNNYVYADTWLELKSLKLKVTEQASSSARSKDPVLAAQSLQALRSTKEDLSRLKERISTVSLWK